MNKYTYISILFHVAVFLLTMLSLPRLAKDPPPLEMISTVELVDLADIAQTNVEDKPQEEKAEDKAPAPPKPVYNNTDSAPDLLSPKPPEIEEVPDIPEEVVEEIKPAPKPKSKPKPPKKPEPTPPKEEPPEEKKEDQKDFTSLLKSLTPDEPDPPAPTESEPKPDDQGQVSQIADFAKQMTRSELDDLNRGVQPCWNVNAGGKDAQDLNVRLRVFVNPEMRVSEVQILDQLRYNTDTHFRAAAEAARRALLNPACSSLRLPPEKYEQWKVFIYNFDPKGML